MIDMELFELMKVTLAEVLRAQLNPLGTCLQPIPEQAADLAFSFALAAKQRLDRHRPSAPMHDPHAATIPPPVKCQTFGCERVAIKDSDYCKGHQD